MYRPFPLGDEVPGQLDWSRWDAMTIAPHRVCIDGRPIGIMAEWTIALVC